MRTSVRITLRLLLLHAAILGLLNGVVADEVAIKIIPVSERRPAPDVILENLQGTNSSLTEHKHKLVLLNFWATWCIPCRQEMPSMEALWQKYRAQGLVVMAVSIDEGPHQRVALFQQKLKLSFLILLDPNDKAGSAYEVSGLPTSYLIDRQGNIISRIVGSLNWSSPATERVIEELL